MLVYAESAFVKSAFYRPTLWIHRPTQRSSNIQLQKQEGKHMFDLRGPLLSLWACDRVDVGAASLQTAVIWAASSCCCRWISQSCKLFTKDFLALLMLLQTQCDNLPCKQRGDLVNSSNGQYSCSPVQLNVSEQFIFQLVLVRTCCHQQRAHRAAGIDQVQQVWVCESVKGSCWPPASFFSSDSVSSVPQGWGLLLGKG